MPARDRWLWIAAVAGPLAWFLDETVSWSVTPAAYERGPSWPLHLVSALALAVAIASTIVAWRRVPQADSTRARMMAYGALVLGLLAILLVLATAVPKWMLAPGAEP
jgi:hypothetical protein